jgi:5-methylcytosine-specific restriction enzyme subunit McrC
MARILQVVEHSTLTIGETRRGVTFEERHYRQLFQYLEDHAAHRYYEMRLNGVRFRNYVGVIQVIDLTIEILPKVDDITDASEESLSQWHDVLLRMLHESGTLPLDSLSNAMLREKENSLLDVYLTLFLNEVEGLLHRGLIKRYRHKEGQQNALRGTLQFSKHIAHNLVHQERFYTRHQTYDHQHLHNQLVRQALLLLPRLTTSPTLRGRAARALLSWADIPTIKVTAATFARLSYNRKTEAYRPAMVIARLLLLNHRPDLRGGDNDLIALLFNMNQLWERYVLRTLQRLYCPHGWTVSKPGYKTFWKAEGKITSEMQPDILIEVPGKGNMVLDAKWKRPNGLPAEADLRQLYAYAHHYRARQTFLLYPHTTAETAVTGTFLQPEHLPTCLEEDIVGCSTVFIQVGNGKPSADADILDTDGYLHCSLGMQFQNWLLKGSSPSSAA